MQVQQEYEQSEEEHNNFAALRVAYSRALQTPQVSSSPEEDFGDTHVVWVERRWLNRYVAVVGELFVGDDIGTRQDPGLVELLAPIGIAIVLLECRVRSRSRSPSRSHRWNLFNPC